MPSPFPGMNPYLEQDYAWHDFQESYLPLVREMLSAQVLPRYFVKIDEHILVHELEENSQQLLGRADVGVAPGAGPRGGYTGAAVLEAPTHAWLPHVDTERLCYLEIRDRENRQLVTVIELLSPTNKRPGRDREQYLAKRSRLLNSSVHFVEIDLLRGHPRMPLIDRPSGDYYVLVSRVQEQPRVDVWPIRLRDRLPEIPIPLRVGDAEAALDLQQALHRLYDAAGYEVYLYDVEPTPPLTPEDAIWARQFIPRKA